MTIRPVRNNFGQQNKNPLISVAKMDADINNHAWLDLLQTELKIQMSIFDSKHSVEQLFEIRDLCNTIINVLDPALQDTWTNGQVATYGDYSDRCIAMIADIPTMPAQDQEPAQETGPDSASAKTALPDEIVNDENFVADRDDTIATE